MMTNDARYTREIKSSFIMAKATFNNKKTLVTATMELSVMKKLVKRCICSIALDGAETWTLRTVDHK
jgi:hypothetical protein